MSDHHAPMPGAEDLAEPMRSRWSPRVFDGEFLLSADQIETLLHAAQWSPSCGNSQPWVFFPAVRGDATHQVLVPHLSRGNSGWVPKASLVLITVARHGEKPTGYEEYDLGQAAAHLTLQARSMGLHAHQFAGFDHEAVGAAIGVPHEHRVMSGIAIGKHGDPARADEGTAAREQRERARKPLSDFVFSTWGEAWRP